MSGFQPRHSSSAARDPEEIEFDTVPPAASSRARVSSEDPISLSYKVAHVLDRLFPVRGTGARFGLDPIIGLIPGVGDALSAALGSIILLEAMRLQAPRSLILRMAANVSINALIGALPLIGDIFSFLFQSNARNYALLRSWQTGAKSPPRAIPGKWLAAGCIALILAATALCALAIWIVSALWKWLAA